LLSYEADQNPSDTVLVQGKTYVYFKSPSLLRAAQPLDDTKPHYPARKPDYIHGAVQLRLLIDEAGKLERVVVLCSNPTFEKSALASIEHMRFTPAQSVSGPVPSYMVVEFGYGRGFPCTTVPDLSPSK
jgi:TonB family protein